MASTKKCPLKCFNDSTRVTDGGVEHCYPTVSYPQGWRGRLKMEIFKWHEQFCGLVVWRDLNFIHYSSLYSIKQKAKKTTGLIFFLWWRRWIQVKISPVKNVAKAKYLVIFQLLKMFKVKNRIFFFVIILFYPFCRYFHIKIFWPVLWFVAWMVTFWPEFCYKSIPGYPARKTKVVLKARIFC